MAIVAAGLRSFFEATPEGSHKRFTVFAATSSCLLAKRVFTAVNPWPAAALVGTINLVSITFFVWMGSKLTDRIKRDVTLTDQLKQKKIGRVCVIVDSCRYIAVVSLEVLAASMWLSSVQAVAFIAIVNLSANFGVKIMDGCIASYRLWSEKAPNFHGHVHAHHSHAHTHGGGHVYGHTHGHTHGSSLSIDQADDEGSWWRRRSHW